MITRQRAYTGFWACVAAIILYSITRVESWGALCLTILVLSLAGVRRDAKPTPWPVFLPAGCMTLVVFYFIYKHAGPCWELIVGWQTRNVHHWLHWNSLFDAIPGNDAAWLRLWQPSWLTRYMQGVYSFGFTLSYWVCVIRAFFTKDVSKFARYSLAGYLLQVPLVLPFYHTILLQEVWFVEDSPDLLQRELTPQQQAQTAMNCFPSLHTSIAFAAILLVRKERSVLYRALITIFGASIIVSTLYLKIHWVLDVVAGMAFACLCVKLADRIVDSRTFAKVIAAWERIGILLYAFVAAGESSSSPEQPDSR